MDEKTMDVFDPSSMEIKYQVAGKTLTLRPLKWGSYRKLVKMTALTPTDQGEHIFEMLKLLFPGPEHDFLTPEFFDNEMTIAMSAKIIQQSGEINGIPKVKEGV
jgi:hypothetical protein